jgi:hypothetical protein
MIKCFKVPWFAMYTLLFKKIPQIQKSNGIKLGEQEDHFISPPGPMKCSGKVFLNIQQFEQTEVMLRPGKK